MATRFLITGGGSVTWDASNTAIWAATSGGATGASVPGSSDTVTMDGSSGGGTVTLAYSPTVISITMGAFTGTFDAAIYSPTMSSFSNSGTATRTLLMGSGTWTLTGSNGTIWNMNVVTNATVTPGTSTVNCTYSGGIGTRSISTGLAINNLKVSAGTDIIALGVNLLVNDFDLTGFRGTWFNLTVIMTGNLTLGAGMTLSDTSHSITMTPSILVKLTTNNVLVDTALTINGTGSVVLQDNLTLGSTRVLTLTQGTLDSNNKNVICATFSSNNTNTRSIIMRSSLWRVTSTGTVWNLATITGLTIDAGTSTIELSNTSSSSKTFSGGGLVYNNFLISGTGTGTYTIIESNTFNSFRDINNSTHKINFTAGTTTTVNTFSVAGSIGHLTTLKSDVDASTWTLSVASGTVNIRYAALQDAIATGGATFYAINSTNTSNNTGWIFRLSNRHSGFLLTENVYRDSDETIDFVPTISSGTGAPTTTPIKIGDIYVDIVTPTVYVAKGTGNSLDWFTDDKFPHYVIAKDGTGDFNCTGTDWTGNDQVVINAAFNSMPSNSVVVFKPATYYFKGKGKVNAVATDWGSIHIEKTVHVFAHGAVFDAKQDAEAQTPNVDDEYIVAFQPVDDHACDYSSWNGGTFKFTDRESNPTIRGGTIWGFAGTGSTGGVYKIFKGLKVRDIVVDKSSSVMFGAFGVYTLEVSDVSVSGSSFYNLGNTAVIYELHQSDSIVANQGLNVSNCFAKGCGEILSFVDSTETWNGIVINGFICDGNYAGINLAGAYNINLGNIVITNCTDFGIIIGKNLSGYTVNSVNLSNIHIDGVGNNGDGILFERVVDKISLNNITIKNVGRNGIYFERPFLKEVLINNLHIDMPITSTGHGIQSFWDSSGDKNKFISINNAYINAYKDGIKLNGFLQIVLSNIEVTGSGLNLALNTAINILTDSVDVSMTNVNINVADWVGVNYFFLANSGLKNSIACNQYKDSIGSSLGVDIYSPKTTKASSDLGVGNVAFYQFTNTDTTANNIAGLHFRGVDLSGSERTNMSIDFIGVDHATGAQSAAFAIATRCMGIYSEKFRVHTNGNIGGGVAVPLANMHLKQVTAGIGTVSNSAGGTTVTGVGTQFLNTFRIGDTITINGETVAISAIASDTSITVAAITGANSAVAYTLVGGDRHLKYGSGLSKSRAGTTASKMVTHGGKIKDFFTDAGNGTTVETDLYSYTTEANLLGINGDTIEYDIGGLFVSSATATRQVKLYFGGTAIFDSGALTLSLSAAWNIYMTIVRVSATAIRYTISMTTEGAALAAYTACGELTGLTLSSTNILKVTGQAAGVGAATNDIVAKLGTVYWYPVSI